ncbi:MAG: AAA family ATPase, partial [Candidatus Pristimantibacillus sp.]
MKLLEARIDGFGQLQGLNCPLDAPAVILYGLNEAGKSTLFGFIRTILYGFSKRNHAAERMEPVNGGAHGGQLLFEDDAGIRYLAERYANKGGGKLMLRTLDAEGSEGEESWLAQDEWERRFLGGTNERLFRQLYAITLTELQEVGALSGDELGRYLYHAGWEGGNHIIAAEKRLQLEMESLFKPRGVNQTMNKQLKSLEQTESELRKQADAITTYNEMKRQLEQLELELERLGEVVPKRLASAQLIAKACSVRPQWLQRLAMQAEREGIAQAERISAEAEHEWNELSAERSARKEELEQSRRKLQLYEQQREAIVLNEQLLAHAEEVDSLLLGSERMELLQQERIEFAMELRSDDDVIGQLFGRIAPDWTEEQQADLSITVADREYVRGVRQLESEAARAEERLNAELQAAAEQERDALQSLAEVDDELARLESIAASSNKLGTEFIPRTKESLRAAWNACDAALREWELERLRNGAADEAGRREAGPWVWAGAAAAGGAALALGA